MLLEQGADVNAQGGEDGDALQAASYGGHKEVVQMLLEQGATSAALQHLLSTYASMDTSRIFRRHGGPRLVG